MPRLFKTIDEIKVFCPMIASSEFGNFSPFIDQAERDFILPYIGSEQYNALVTAYNNDEEGSGDDITAEQQALLEKIQAALAFYMEYLWIPSGQVSIGDGGIRVAYTDTMKPAFAWQIKDLRREVIRQAGSAMDALLEFLEQNKDDYPLWTDSDVYPDSKSTFIVSAKEFTKYYAPLASSRLNYLAVLPTMKRVEEFVIQSELGVEFYAELKEQFIDDDLTPANELVVTYIKKALAPLTISQAVRDLTASVDERGILMFNSTSATDVVDAKLPAIDTVISKIEFGCEKDGRSYIQLLKNFLKANITDYPTYSESTAYDSSTTNQTFTSGADDSIHAML